MNASNTLYKLLHYVLQLTVAHCSGVALYTLQQPLLQVILEKARDEDADEEQRIEAKLDVLLGTDTVEADKLNADMLNTYTTVTSLIRGFPNAAAKVRLAEICRVSRVEVEVTSSTACSLPLTLSCM
jgi:ABC-type Na+ efflux pump permease subunit